MPTFMDIVRANNADKDVGLIDETIRLHPELTLADTREIPGISYTTLVRTALGNTGGSFRTANSGSAPISHTYENRRVECYIMEPRFQSDKAVADAYTDGAPAYIAMETGGTLEGEFQALSKQFYYGAGSGYGNTLGFPGLVDAYDASNMVIDAGGTTANTGTSVWLVRFGPQQVRWVLGNGGRFSFSPVRIESIIDPNNSARKFDGYVQTMVARPGLQVGSLWSAVRIKKITNDAGCGLNDALLYRALALFPAGTQPDVILANRRSLSQLRQSRTATNPTGAPAPIPKEIEGLGDTSIPIKVTDSISNVESLTL